MRRLILSTCQLQFSDLLCYNPHPVNGAILWPEHKYHEVVILRGPNIKQYYACLISKSSFARSVESHPMLASRVSGSCIRTAEEAMTTLMDIVSTLMFEHLDKHYKRLPPGGSPSLPPKSEPASSKKRERVVKLVVDDDASECS